ncbi:MAG: hypothetical protein U0984_16715 [Prosthecobacter sp.]|nr:hypothetical protein [Prosthecobacter sp.]
MINKQAVLDLILAALTAELEAITRGARASFAAATDPDSKAENKYDTRTLEASYVARGQAQRVAELDSALHAFRALSGNPWPAGSSIATGALVTLQTPAGDSEFYFLGPAAGGTEVRHEAQEILVITPTSPLGQKLLGKKRGDRIDLRPGHPAVVAAVR